MENGRTTIFSAGFFLLAALIPLCAIPSSAIRAALDFTFIAYDSGRSEEIRCDFCSHVYSDGKTRFTTYEVNAKEGYVGIAFTGEGSPDKHIKFSYYGNPGPLSSTEPEFEVDYLQGVMVREGQTVRLRGTGFGFKLIKASGLGCPPGAMCGISPESNVITETVLLYH